MFCFNRMIHGLYEHRGAVAIGTHSPTSLLPLETVQRNHIQYLLSSKHTQLDLRAKRNSFCFHSPHKRWKKRKCIGTYKAPATRSPTQYPTKYPTSPPSVTKSPTPYPTAPPTDEKPPVCMDFTSKTSCKAVGCPCLLIRRRL